MHIPILGDLIEDTDSGWYISKEFSLKVLNNHPCAFVLEGYEEDENQEEFHDAIKNFLSIDHQVLKNAEEAIFNYYLEVKNYTDPDYDFPIINSPSEVWKLITFGNQAIVSRRAYGDHAVYIAMENECQWEIEHGLMIVFKNGAVVTKIGQYDGHLSNADAYGNKDFENMIYIQSGDLNFTSEANADNKPWWKLW